MRLHRTVVAAAVLCATGPALAAELPRVVGQTLRQAPQRVGGALHSRMRVHLAAPPSALLGVTYIVNGKVHGFATAQSGFAVTIAVHGSANVTARLQYRDGRVEDLGGLVQADSRVTNAVLQQNARVQKPVAVTKVDAPARTSPGALARLGRLLRDLYGSLGR